MLHIYWYIILHNPVERQFKGFYRLGMSFIELIWLLGKLSCYGNLEVLE